MFHGSIPTLEFGGVGSSGQGAYRGKASFDAKQLQENYFAALDEIMRLKPNASKGRYLKKVTVSSTMGPGVAVDPQRTKAADEA